MADTCWGCQDASSCSLSIDEFFVKHRHCDETDNLMRDISRIWDDTIYGPCLSDGKEIEWWSVESIKAHYTEHVQIPEDPSCKYPCDTCFVWRVDEFSKTKQFRVRGVARGVQYPTEDGYIVIPAWSRGARPWKDLTPFHLTLESASCFENFWQAKKVYAKLEKKNFWHSTESPIGPDGNPTEVWQKWHDTVCAYPEPLRRPNGKNIPLYVWHEGEKLGVVDARKKIYIPVYQELIRKHPTYHRLLEIGSNRLIILEPDGPDPEEFPQGKPVTYVELLEMQHKVERNGKYFPYGHGYVILLTLFEDLYKLSQV